VTRRRALEAGLAAVLAVRRRHTRAAAGVAAAVARGHAGRTAAASPRRGATRNDESVVDAALCG